jgi:PIN domain nuclease of toxin-antitoxin system
MSKVVLDASAVMALLNREPGADNLTLDLLNRAVISAVNLAEIQTVLVNRGIAPDDAWRDASSPVRDVAAFTEDQARTTGSLVDRTRALGLSLGDRACLSLGMSLGAPVYTANRAWKKLKLGIPIHLLR